jgi:hypothetical protein
MTWIPLSSRLDSLPLILAGPILRRVEKDTVSVWLALKEERKDIVLTVYDEKDVPQMTAMRDTVPLGQYLHVVVLTASLLPGKDILKPNITYEYEVIGPGLDLKGDANYCYNNYKLPTFSLPPANLGDLRIIHASCRKLHSPDDDALVALDGIIERASWPLPTEAVVYPAPSFARTRPHQLFLTGDQIYADDVDAVLLFLIRDVQQGLLGWAEDLPIGPATAPKGFRDGGYTPADLEPGQRSELMKAESGFQFPSEWEVVANHLINLGDFYGMYLLMWSPVLWPGTTGYSYPTFEDVYSKYGQPNAALNSKQQKERAELEKKFNESLARVIDYPRQLQPIRKALANIPTYMICDDHEITDDWFLDMNWCKEALSKALGRRIMQNGMTAYALFQAWGNTPEQFNAGPTGTPVKPGQQLLLTLPKWKDGSPAYIQPDAQRLFPTGVANPSYWDTMYALLGLPDLAKTVANRALTPVSANRLTYNFYINWGAHEVFVLDTRTHRAYPGTLDSNFAALISRPSLETQLSAFSPSAEVTFLVIATPISGVPHIEEDLLNKARKALRYSLPLLHGEISTASNINYVTDAEAYGYQMEGLQNLYAVIAARVAARKAVTTLSGPARIVVLSGDVHYGFTNRVEFWGTRFYGMTDADAALATPAHFVLAQLCASALKNETDGFKGIHYNPVVDTQVNTGNIGLLSMHQEGYTKSEIENPSEYVGWVLSTPGSLPKEVGIWKYYSKQEAKWYVKENEQVFDLRKKRFVNDTLVQAYLVNPDWTYRINYIKTIPGQIRYTSLVPKPLTSPLSASEKKFEAFLTAQENYNTYFRFDGPGRQIVGKNNIGEVFFEWGTTETTKQIRHNLWWSTTSPITGRNDPEKSPLSQFRLLLGEDASQYQKPTP